MNAEAELVGLCLAKERQTGKCRPEYREEKVDNKSIGFGMATEYNVCSLHVHLSIY